MQPLKDFRFLLVLVVIFAVILLFLYPRLLATSLFGELRSQFVDNAQNFVAPTERTLNSVCNCNCNCNCNTTACPESVQNKIDPPSSKVSSSPSPKRIIRDWPLQCEQHAKKLGPDGSQGGQDGILNWIFENIGETNRYFVEFGFNAGTYEECSANTHQLFKRGWRGLLLDGSNTNPEINLHPHILAEENILELFDQYGVPKEPDYVSIDVDSIDLWLFKKIINRKLSPYRPRVLTVEYNQEFPFESTLTYQRKWEKDLIQTPGSKAFGTSLHALKLVAEESGYTLVAVWPGLDAFFVRDDLLEDTVVNSWEYYRDKCGNQNPYFTPANDSQVLLDYLTFVKTEENEQLAKKSALLDIYRNYLIHGYWLCADVCEKLDVCNLSS